MFHSGINNQLNNTSHRLIVTERMEHKITPVDGDLADLLNKTWTPYYRRGYVKIDGFIVTQDLKEFVDEIENFEVRDDDIWVCTFPKTGTTWTQEMVFCIATDLDFERAKESLPERFPCLEFTSVFEWEEIKRRNPGVEIPDLATDSLSYTAKLPSPRFIKSHLPFNLLPRQLRTGEKTPRIICVYRDPKDTCISFYHYCVLAEGFNGTFEDFTNLFLGDTVYYAPFWSHILSYWNHRNDRNMLILRYEEMKKDLPSAIKATAKFLGKNLTNDQLSLLSEHLSFDSMKVNPSVNYEQLIKKLHEMMKLKCEGKFMRSGTSEQWKTVMSPELIKRFDDWTRERLNDTDFTF